MAALSTTTGPGSLSSALGLEKMIEIELFSQVYQIDDTELLSAETIINKSQEVSTYCGVYFLLYENNIVYVGSSKNIHQRLTSHQGLFSEKKFDKVFFVEIEEEKREYFEAKYILKFMPKYNSLTDQMLQKYISLSRYWGDEGDDVPF